MATSRVNPEFIEAVAAEMVTGIHAALEWWMAKIERVLGNRNLTPLGRLRAVQEILAEYKCVSGKTDLEDQESATAH